MSNLIGILIALSVVIFGVVCSVCLVRSIDIIIFKFRMLKRHIERWNYWRKHNTNSKLHKVLILLKLKYSPTFAMTMHPKDIERMMKNIQKGINGFSESLNQLSKNAYEAASALAESISKLNQDVERHNTEEKEINNEERINMK